MAETQEMLPLSCSPSQESFDQPDMPRKLAILGLPWDTSEDTFRLYFSQFGVLEHAEIMKDRYTGKSRGFGFVTFVDKAAAHRALVAEHSIDGRRCEAKVALPKGEPAANKTTRIFIARIPPSVTEAQFRAYFEKFGKMQDAYMPKDHSKQGYRGIGFVTFATPESVEKVMATKHWLNGHEVAIDRANPKEDGSAIRQMLNRVPGANNGATNASGNSNVTNGTANANGEEASGPTLRNMSMDAQQGMLHQVSNMRTPPSMNLVGNLNLQQQAAMGQQLQLAKAQAQNVLQGMGVGMPIGGMQLPGHQGLSNLPPELSATLLNTAAANNALVMAATAAGKRLDASAVKRLENPAIANARAGPRLFIGKLTKDTSETDVKEYFQKFGYVMDVYLPKAKDNKTEHRGFGFVTFETDAAIQRVVAHGTHRLKGSTIAIDLAMPKVEESEVSIDSGVEGATAAGAAGNNKEHHNSTEGNVNMDPPLWMWPAMQMAPNQV